MARVILLTDFSEAYARRLLLGISQYAHYANEAWSLTRLPSTLLDTEGIEKVIEYARKLKTDAVIGQFRSIDELERLHEHGIIPIAQDFQIRFDNFPNIVGNHYLTGKMAAEHFVSKGFRSFAFYGPRDRIFSSERFKGFKDTVAALSPESTFYSLRPSDSNVWEYDFEELSSWLMYLPKPVAVMAADDNWAYYVTEACHLTKAEFPNADVSIPENVAIIGVDNDETICNLSSPNLSSIDQDVESGGFKVAKLISSMLNGEIKTMENVLVMPTNIVTRQSSDIYINADNNITKVLKFIHANITRKLSVEDVVAQVPLSRRLLETKFRENMGTSIYDYIINARIDKMCDLLLEGKSIKEASSELGFFDSKNTSRIFKKIKGTTPTEFIRQNRKEKYPSYISRSNLSRKR